MRSLPQRVGARKLIAFLGSSNSTTSRLLGVSLNEPDDAMRERSALPNAGIPSRRDRRVDKPIDIKAEVIIDNDAIAVDYDGSSPPLILASTSASTTRPVHESA